MTTILTKKRDTSGAPAAGDLTNSAGGAELAVNTADKRLYTKDGSGNVIEIGTNPTILNIDNIEINGNTISSTNSNGNIILAPNGTGQIVVNAGAVGTPIISPTGDSNTGIFFPAADTIAFSEGGVEAMRINSLGNVGIGTNNPNTRLTVTGSGSSVELYQDVSSIRFASTPNRTNSWYIGANISDSVDGGFFIGSGANIGTGTSRLFISSVGYVGIGNSNAAFPLDVQADTSAFGIRIRGRAADDISILRFVNNAANTIIGQFDVRPTSFIINAVANASMVFNTNNTERMSIGAGGNVSIGIDAGDTLRYFDVQNVNSGSSAGSIIRLITSNAAGSGPTSTDIVKYKFGGFYINNNETNSAAFTAFQVGASERMRISSGGNIGVANTPNNWGVNHRAIQIGSGGNQGAIAGQTNANVLFLTSNGFFDGSNWIYGNSTPAGLYQINQNVHAWSYAATGTAGNAISYTEAMRIASNGRVGISTASPSFQLQVNSFTEWGVTLRAASDTTSFRCLYLTQRARGSLASPTVPTAGTIIGGTEAGGWTGSDYTAGFNGGASIQIQAEGTWTSTSCPSSISFWTNPAGSAGYIDRMRIQQDGAIRFNCSGATISHSFTFNENGGEIDLYDETGNIATLIDQASNSSRFLELINGSNVFIGTASGNTTGVLQFATQNTERSRITAAGYQLWNTSSANFSTIGDGNVMSIRGSMVMGIDGFGDAIGFGLVSRLNPSAAGGNGWPLYCLNGSGTNNGGIYNTSSTTSFVTSSDYRLKENQELLTGSGAFIDALQPKTWTWKSTGEKGVGFIAHEVQEVSPSSVIGKKDDVDEKGKPKYQSMEYGSAEFIANIIAELQDLRKRVAALESKSTL